MLRHKFVLDLTFATVFWEMTILIGAFSERFLRLALRNLMASEEMKGIDMGKETAERAA